MFIKCFVEKGIEVNIEEKCYKGFAIPKSK